MSDQNGKDRNDKKWYLLTQEEHQAAYAKRERNLINAKRDEFTQQVLVAVGHLLIKSKDEPINDLDTVHEYLSDSVVNLISLEDSQVSVYRAAQWVYNRFVLGDEIEDMSLSYARCFTKDLSIESKHQENTANQTFQ